MEVALSEGWFLSLNNSLQSDSSHSVENLYTKRTYLDIWEFHAFNRDVFIGDLFPLFSQSKDYYSSYNC